MSRPLPPTRRRTIAAALAGLLLAGCASPPAALQTDLARRHEQFARAMASKDLDLLTRLFGDHAVLHMADHPPAQGRDAVQRFFASAFGFLESSTVTAQDLRISAAGDLAVVRGASVNVFRRGGSDSRFVGKYLLVWERQAGAWVIASYALSSDGPGAGGKPAPAPAGPTPRTP